LAHASDFTDISKIVSIAKDIKADAVHPGYGFLSESPEFADALQTAGIQFIGPSSAVLRQTSDKIDARRLAEQNGIPTLPASTKAIRDFDEAVALVSNIGLPVMIKAVDGGGGRGIRLVRQQDELQANFDRACGESPSGSVFIEQAAIDGFRHVEVQILGDHHGDVGHLWERECSIQRR
jgi:pyruvate carboxylase